MRRRPSSRILVIDPSERVLLFRFVINRGAIAGQDFWATPGGTLDADETFEEAARRELFEETGIVVEAVGEAVAEREFIFQLFDGERVMAHEQFFFVRTTGQEVSKDRWTALEKEVMVEHRWWSLAELASTSDQVFPENLIEILKTAGVGAGA
ncbi:MAG TPA: NUDIX domain-containing protein [Blastocatellia bacterium]|nr:NUDIX domain-containing protein [Blastocatellia bacterium]